jgi:hypothetical protein
MPSSIRSIWQVRPRLDQLSMLSFTIVPLEAGSLPRDYARRRQSRLKHACRQGQTVAFSSSESNWNEVGPLKSVVPEKWRRTRWPATLVGIVKVSTCQEVVAPSWLLHWRTAWSWRLLVSRTVRATVS